MYLKNIDPKKTALLIIDMQNDFLKPGAPVFSQMGYDMCDKLSEVADVFRQKGSLIIYSQNVIRPDLLDMGKSGEFSECLKQGKCGIDGTEGVELYEKIAPKKGDVVLKKSKYSFFYGTQLDNILRTAGITTVVITGVCTDCCCFSTARDAALYNYDVAFISDLTGTVDYKDIGYGDFTAEQVQACYLTTIALTTGDVMTADDLLSRLL